MHDQNKNSENRLEVTVQAIDGEALVLETTNGDLIHWPLNQLQKTLPLGKNLILKLEPTDHPPEPESKSPKIKGYVTTAKDLKTPTSSADSKESTTKSPAPSKEITVSATTESEEDPKNARMRKMLEGLING